MVLALFGIWIPLHGSRLKKELILTGNGQILGMLTIHSMTMKMSRGTSKLCYSHISYIIAPYFNFYRTFSVHVFNKSNVRLI